MTRQGTSKRTGGGLSDEERGMKMKTYETYIAIIIRTHRVISLRGQKHQTHTHKHTQTISLKQEEETGFMSQSSKTAGVIGQESLWMNSLFSIFQIFT